MLKEKLSILKELWLYFKIRRRGVIFALIIFIVILGFMITLAENPVLAPFIYPIF